MKNHESSLAMALFFALTLLACGGGGGGGPSGGSPQPAGYTLKADAFVLKTGADAERMGFIAYLQDASGKKRPVEQYTVVITTPDGRAYSMFAHDDVNEFYMELANCELGDYTFEADGNKIKDNVIHLNIPPAPYVRIIDHDDGVTVETSAPGFDKTLLSVEKVVDGKGVYFDPLLYNTEFVSPARFKLPPGNYQLRVTGVLNDLSPEFAGDTDLRVRSNWDGFKVGNDAGSGSVGDISGFTQQLHGPSVQGILGWTAFTGAAKYWVSVKFDNQLVQEGYVTVPSVAFIPPAKGKYTVRVEADNTQGELIAEGEDGFTVD